MEIMDLIRRDRRSLEDRESSMCKCRLVRLASRPVLPRHIAVVSGWRAPREAVALIVRTHAVKPAAAGEPPSEVVDVRQFDAGLRDLVVIPILIEPRDGIWVRSAI